MTEGVFVYGLFLDGAGWDKRNIRLTESTNKVLYTLIPVVRVFAVYATDPRSPTLYIVSKQKTEI
ncbi:hypothetical protein NQ314_017566 [Rhamnusium bicolor]|uniref:Dynein heavy chain C-terminal domain-containing protein n=1 Tax=Rhamnusium bicolor TaxID=1586634 RepID=A0AAV8WTG3_9CUCU|nr:hypothetical protein NQ314_017566 [Rhamnusium bicolor]